MDNPLKQDETKKTRGADERKDRTTTQPAQEIPQKNPTRENAPQPDDTTAP